MFSGYWLNWFYISVVSSLEWITKRQNHIWCVLSNFDQIKQIDRICNAHQQVPKTKGTCMDAHRCYTFSAEQTNPISSSIPSTKNSNNKKCTLCNNIVVVISYVLNQIHFTYFCWEMDFYFQYKAISNLIKFYLMHFPLASIFLHSPLFSCLSRIHYWNIFMIEFSSSYCEGDRESEGEWRERKMNG